MKKKMLAWLLALAMVFTSMPMTADATENVTSETSVDDETQDQVSEDTDENTTTENTPVVTSEEDTEESKPSANETNSVAKVGNTEYATIDDAIANWTAGTTLTLLSDVTLSDVVKLKSTEHHYLELGTYTMKAASGKNAIEIVAYGTGDAERGALTITANTTSPGGINAGNKSCIYYNYANGGITTNDRPIIYIKGGVFTGMTSALLSAGIYNKGTAARKCATLNISGGTFNCSILGTGKSKLLISGGTFNYSVGSQGDSTCYRLISGGTFESFGFMTADAANKFGVGTALNNYNVGVYVDDNGYLVVGGPVINEPGTKFEASSANYGGWNSYLQYSSAKDNGLYYTSVEEALADNDKTTGEVIVYADELDLTNLSYKGKIIVPEGSNLAITYKEGATPVTVVNADGKVIEPAKSVVDGIVTYTYKVMSASTVATIGDNEYEALEDAFSAAKDGDEVKILKAGTYALSTSGKNITITGTVDGVVFDNIGAKNMGGADVTFNHVTFNYTNANYTGLQHSGNLIYNDCTINGQPFLYGTSETFNICTFNQTSSDAYNVWTYGAKEVEFNKCTFNSAGKSVLIYSEDANLFNEIKVVDCDFIASTAVDGKAAIEMDSSLTAGIKLTIDQETTVSGFGTGNVSKISLWNNKKGSEGDNNDITVIVNGETVLEPKFVAQIGDTKYDTLQSAIDACVAGNNTIKVLNDITENVKITQKENVNITIDGAGKTFTGVITVFGSGRHKGEETLMIKDVVFQSTEGADSCILSPDREVNNSYSYSHNVTVDGCTFKGSEEDPYTVAAVRHEDGGDVNWTIKNCTVDENMHSLIQTNNVNGKLTIKDCTVNSKNGANLNSCTNVEITGCTFEVKGYAVRAGVSSGGNLGEVKTFVINNNILKTDNSEGDAVIVLRASAVDMELSMEKNVVSGNTHISGTTDATIVNADANYWDGKDTPVVADNSTKVEVNTYYADEALTDLRNVYVAQVEEKKYKSLQEAIDVATDAAIVKLISGITLTESIKVTNRITLDLNGYTIEGIDKNTSGNFYLINVNKGNLTIDDSVGGGAITLTATTERNWSASSVVVANNQGTFTVNAGTIEHLGGTSMAYGIDNLTNNTNGNAITTIKGGSVDATYFAIRQFANSATTMNTVVIEDGDVGYVWMQSPNNNVNTATTTVTGGEVDGICVTGANADYDLSAAAANVGEVYGTMPTGMALVNTNGIYSLAKAVAENNGILYASIEEAIDNASENDPVVKIVSDCSVKESIVVDSDITIDFNGYTVSAAEEFEDACIFRITADVVFTDTCENKAGGVDGTTGNVYAAIVGKTLGKGSLVIDAGTYNGTTTAVSVTKGTLTINDGVFKATEYEGAYEFLLNCIDLNYKLGVAKIEVKGGTFYNFDPANNKAEGNDTSFVAKGYVTNYDESEKTYTVLRGLSGSGTEKDPYLINNLEDLIWFRDKVDEQAADGSTQFAGKYFKLTADIDLAGINWNPIGSMSGDHGSFLGIFDGDGHTISNLKVEQAGNGIGLFARTAGNAVIKNLTLNNVSVKSTDNSNYVGAVVANSFASTKIENVHIKGNIDISGRGYIGGISGHGYVVMDNVSVVGEGTISSTFWCAGGILGYGGEGATNITNAKVEGTGNGLTITSAAGGLGAIVGMAEDNNGKQPISGSNLTAKNVDIETYTGAYGDSYANYALGYLYGGADTSKLTGDLIVDDVDITTSTGEEPEVVDAVAVGNDAIYFNLQSAVDAGGEIKVVRDVNITDTVTIPADKTVTLNLSRHTITGIPLEAKAYSVIINKGTLTIEGEGTIVCDHKLTGSTAYAVNTITNSGTLIIENGIIENTSIANNQIGYAIDNNSTSADAVVTINGGEIKVSGSDYYDGIRQFCNSETKENSVTVDGGKVSSIWLQNPSDGSDRNTKEVNGTVTIKSGTVENLYLEPSTGFEAAITGGNINKVSAFETAEGRDLAGFIFGGIFKDKPDESYIADGFIVVDNGDGTYGIKAINYVAQIGDNKYRSLKAAIDEVKENETIILLTDTTLTEKITIDKPITLDLNGKTVTGADGEIVFNIEADTTIENGTIKGNKSGTSSGLIDIYADLDMNGVTVETSKINALRFKAGDCTATLKDCNVTGAFKGYGGSVWDIQSGTYKASSTSVNDQLNGTAAVSGGTFHYTIDEAECAPGYVTVDNGDGTHSVKYAPALFVDTNQNGELDEGEAVYGNLDQLFANHQEGDVHVVLTDDVVANSQVDTDADAHYYFTTNVAGGVKMDFLFADDWNYIQMASVGENITLNAPYLLAWTEFELEGTVNTDYAYFTTANVTICDGAVLNANTGDATVQVKNGANMIVNGTVNTAILNVWAGESKLTVSGKNAEVNASWIDIWDGTPSVIVEKDAELYAKSVKASRGGSITVDDATLKAEDIIELGHNGESAGTMTVTGNSRVSEVKLTVVGSTVTGPANMNVVTGVDGYDVVYENGIYSLTENEFVAEVNGTQYKTLSEAFDVAAESAGTVNLLKDQEDPERTTIVPSGVTLDLNGKVLTAKNVLAFGTVIDTAADDVGGIEISNNTEEAIVHLQLENDGYLPIYDTDENCYRFFKGIMQHMVMSIPSDQVKVYIKLTFDNKEAYKVLANTSEVKVCTNITWNGSIAPIDYVFKQDTIKGYANAMYEVGELALTLTINGVSKLPADAELTLIPYITTTPETLMYSQVVVQ